MRHGRQIPYRNDRFPAATQDTRIPGKCLPISCKKPRHENTFDVVCYNSQDSRPAFACEQGTYSVTFRLKKRKESPLPVKSRQIRTPATMQAAPTTKERPITSWKKITPMIADVRGCTGYKAEQLDAGRDASPWFQKICATPVHTMPI